jgi:hypothetical protein
MAIPNKIKILKTGVYLLVQTPLKLQFSKNHKCTLQYQTGSKSQPLPFPSCSQQRAPIRRRTSHPRHLPTPKFRRLVGDTPGLGTKYLQPSLESLDAVRTQVQSHSNTVGLLYIHEPTAKMPRAIRGGGSLFKLPHLQHNPEGTFD